MTTEQINAVNEASARVMGWSMKDGAWLDSNTYIAFEELPGLVKINHCGDWICVQEHRRMNAEQLQEFIGSAEALAKTK